MKAEKIVPKKTEQPNPLPASPNQEEKDGLAPWQKQIIALAEARLTTDREDDLIPWTLRTIIGLCRVVEDLTLEAEGDQISLPALCQYVGVIKEQAEVAWWLSAGRPCCRNWGF